MKYRIFNRYDLINMNISYEVDKVDNYDVFLIPRTDFVSEIAFCTTRGAILKVQYGEEERLYIENEIVSSILIANKLEDADYVTDKFLRFHNNIKIKEDHFREVLSDAMDIARNLTTGGDTIDKDELILLQKVEKWFKDRNIKEGDDVDGVKKKRNIK